MFWTRFLFIILLAILGYFSFFYKKSKLRKMARGLFFYIGIVFLVLVVADVGLDIYTKHGENIEVPNITSMSVDEAKQVLKEKELSLAVNDTSYSSNFPVGTVLGQVPFAHSGVKSGRVIYVTVSSDELPMVVLPKLVDLTLRDAKAVLENKNLLLGEVEYVKGWKDLVKGQKLYGDTADINPGVEVPAQTQIVLVVGNGVLTNEN